MYYILLIEKSKYITIYSTAIKSYITFVTQLNSVKGAFKRLLNTNMSHCVEIKKKQTLWFKRQQVYGLKVFTDHQ